ncbi:MAG: hypothetical protein WA021_02450 [Minisyncoccia bacterium]
MEKFENPQGNPDLQKYIKRVQLEKELDDAIKGFKKEDKKRRAK